MRYLSPVLAVVGVALAAFVVYSVALDVTRGDGLRWGAVLEGALIGAAVLAVWLLARSRAAAAVGLGAAAVIVLAATAGFGPADGFVQEPVGWAAILALLVRLFLPEPARR